MSTTTLPMSAMQWAALDDIDDVEPINENDYECLAEIREVLKKHGKRERFGIALLHKHFDMADGEMLVELSNKDERVLTIKPVKQEQAGIVVETIWVLHDDDRNRPMLGCKFYCGKNVQGNHQEFHKEVP